MMAAVMVMVFDSGSGVCVVVIFDGGGVLDVWVVALVSEGVVDEDLKIRWRFLVLVFARFLRELVYVHLVVYLRSCGAVQVRQKANARFNCRPPQYNYSMNIS
jgi:hypothetical protein